MILFDLGNVVFRIDFSRCFAAWSKSTGLPQSKITSHFSMDQAYRRHECGEISTQDYHAHIKNLFGVEISYADFLEGWNAIFCPAIVPTVEFLKTHSELSLYAFSNTNRAHQEHWRQLYSTELANFRKIFCSHEIGLRKPEPAAFARVLEEIGVQPRDTILLDDTLENVLGARQLGINAIHFVDPVAAIAELKSLI